MACWRITFALAAMSVVFALSACGDDGGTAPQTPAVSGTPPLTIPATASRTGTATPELPENLGLFLVDPLTSAVDRVTGGLYGPILGGFLSPEGRLLALRGDPKGLDVLTVATGERVRVFDRGVEAVSWSPDSSQLAIYEFDRGLFIANGDGSGYRKILERGDAPYWAPNGDQIAVVRDVRPQRTPTDDATDFELLLLNARTGARAIYPLGNARFGRGSGIGSPIWSPSGDRVALIPDHRGVPPELVVVTRGRSLSRIQLDGVPAGYAPFLAWSPDEQNIVFTVYGADETSRIFIVPADGSARAKLLAEGGAPLWSHDGDQIAFIGNVCNPDEPDRGFDLMIINGDGSGLRTIGPTEREILEAAWSPTDDRIAFRTVTAIHTIRSDGSGLRRVMEWDDVVNSLGWMPDGKRLWFQSIGGFDLCL
ncbi:MAG: hypothetical protein WBD55_11125 [Dehalococcoidia bacterium]